jgi:predicted nuclease of predicted toxin-antitoxin system
MSFLLNENLALSYAQALRSMGLDAKHVIEVGLNQTKDERIIDFARTNGMAIIAFDLDHTKIVALFGNHVPTILTFRVTQITQESFVGFFEAHYPALQANIEKGALITIDDNGIRVRELPIGKK